MKRLIFLLLSVMIILCVSGCGANKSESTANTASELSASSFSLSEVPSAESNLSSKDSMETEMQRLTITIENQVFEAKLYDNLSAKAFMERLPLTIDMQELNGNEKYHYFSGSLPTDSQKIGDITVGDLMLYGSDCLVLFYQNFHTSYSYTPLGRILDPTGLSDALGTGSVTVTIAK